MMRLFLFLLISLAILNACDDNGNNTDTSVAKVNEVTNRAINGQQWRITNYTESDNNQTWTFADYIFEFDSNNLLTVTNGSDNIAGTWTIVHDGSDDDNNSEFDDIDFNISFTNPPAFAELNDDWEIISISDTTIQLRHTSGGNGGIDLLTFEKI